MRTRWSTILGDKSGNITIKTGLMLGAIAMTLSVLTAPIIDNVSQTYADNTAFGIDRLMTGSIEAKKERYIIRKSVLSRKDERIDLIDSQ